MKVVTFLLTITWLVVGLYLGVAGWEGSKALEKTSVQKRTDGTTAQSFEFEGLNFKDEESLIRFLKQRESIRFFPWIFSMPQSITPLIAAIAFGIVGGSARLLKRLSIDGDQLTLPTVFADPLFGGIVGLTIFFMSLLLPLLFTSGRTPVRPETLVAVSLFGGIFSEQAFAWIQKQIKKFVF